jgi:hypothetical protein
MSMRSPMPAGCRSGRSRFGLLAAAAIVVLGTAQTGSAQDREREGGPPSPEALEQMQREQGDRPMPMPMHRGMPMDRAMRMAMPSDTAHDAVAIVREMADYVGRQQNIRFAYDSDIEIVTPEMEKVQFTSSGMASLSRPDKFRATRTGGYSDVELLADGQSLTVYGKNLQVYAQAEARGPIGAIVDRLRNEFQLDIPAADLLGEDAFNALMEDVIDAKHIGRGVVGGVECDHLAFRNHDTDWQLWVRVGDQPVPCRMVITSKTVGMAPQYTLEFHDWEDGVSFSPGAFTFEPPRGARKVDLTGLSGLDEVPASDAMPGRMMGPHPMPPREGMPRGDMPAESMPAEPMPAEPMPRE